MIRPSRPIAAFKAVRSAVCGVAILFSGGALSAAAQSSKPDLEAFVGVNVVPMNSEDVLLERTVLIADGKITAIGRGLVVPKGARVIDGKGMYLSPGLADMHSHSDTREDLKVYLANGVTTILNMGGASDGFVDSLRPRANKGTIPGPHIYAAFRVDGSPQYNNFFVTTPEEARAIVRIAKTNGYQFIKVYNNLSPECFQALIDEGKLQHMPVVGHGVTAVGLRRQLDAGQVMVAHAEEFLYTVFYDPQNIPEKGAPDDAQIPDALKFVLRDKAFVTADLNTYAKIAGQWGKPKVAAAYLHSPDVRYLSPQDRISWAREDYKTRHGSLDERLRFLQRFTKAMSDAGVPLITGTDAPAIPGVVAGFSLHDDLQALTEAGLSPYQALAAATRTPGEFIRQSLGDGLPFGTVTVGSRADLILTAENPLKNLAALRDPVGVMAAGHWYPRKELHEMLDGVAAEYDQALQR